MKRPGDSIDQPEPKKPLSMMQPQEGALTEQIFVPDNMVGLLIGRGGENITRSGYGALCKISGRGLIQYALKSMLDPEIIFNDNYQGFFLLRPGAQWVNCCMTEILFQKVRGKNRLAWPAMIPGKMLKNTETEIKKCFPLANFPIARYLNLKFGRKVF